MYVILYFYWHSILPCLCGDICYLVFVVAYAVLTQNFCIHECVYRVCFDLFASLAACHTDFFTIASQQILISCRKIPLNLFILKTMLTTHGYSIYILKPAILNSTEKLALNFIYKPIWSK